MTTSGTPFERVPDGRALLGGLLLVAGVGLAGVGSYLHVTVAAQVRAEGCDGCDPWHPLFVLAPLVVGAVSVLLAGSLLSRG